MIIVVGNLWIARVRVVPYNGDEDIVVSRQGATQSPIENQALPVAFGTSFRNDRARITGTNVTGRNR